MCSAVKVFQRQKISLGTGFLGESSRREKRRNFKKNLPLFPDKIFPDKVHFDFPPKFVDKRKPQSQKYRQ